MQVQKTSNGDPGQQAQAERKTYVDESSETGYRRVRQVFNVQANLWLWVKLIEGVRVHCAGYDTRY